MFLLPSQIMNSVSSTAPAGIQTKSALPYFAPYSVYRGMDDSVWSFANFSVAEIIENYKTVAPLAGAINRLAYSVSGLPIGLYDRLKDEVVKEHAVLDLLRYPNADNQKTMRDLFRDLTIWKVLEGDAYLLITGQVNAEPKELYALCANRVTTQTDSRGYIGEFQYSGGGILNRNAAFDKYIRDPVTDRFYNAQRTQELYHMPNFNVDFCAGSLDGQSEVVPLFYEINQYIHTSQHNLALLKNGARPSGAFVLKTKSGEPAILSEEQFNRLKSQIAESYQGAANAGRPLLLEGGLEWVETAISPKDMDFNGLRKQAEEQIYKTLMIPPQMMSSDGVTANNLVNIRREFYQGRVLPFMDDMLDHLNRALLPRYKGKNSAYRYEFRVKRDEIDVLTEERAQRNKIIESSVVLTLNEKRKMLWNLPPIELGDKVVDPNGRPVAGPDAGEIVGGKPGSQMQTEITPPVTDVVPPA